VAAPTQFRPWRSLVVLALAILALAVFAFWPGTAHTPQLGLDLRGGTQVTLTPRTVNGQTISDQQIQQAVEIIRQRVNGLGVAEAEVTTQGNGANSAIIVSIPGVNNQGIADSLKQTALLDFRAVVKEEAGSPVPTPTASPSPTPSGSATAKPAASASPKASASASGNGAALTGGLRAATASPTATPTVSVTPTPVPTSTTAKGTTGDKLLPPIMSDKNDAAFQAKFAALDCSDPATRKGAVPQDPDKWLVTCSTDGKAKYLLQPAFIRGTNISDANAGIPQGGTTWIVNLSFDTEGAKKLATASTEMYTKAPPENQFAIVLDGLVFSSPYFKEPILGGSAQIEGQFTQESAKALANVLKYGALPLSLEVATATSISPTLGQDQLNAGVIAGLLGLLLVVLYLLAYYRVLGLVAVFSLVVAGLITYLLFVILGRTIGFTLTLAGIAGAIVAIGITADSFVVYFERIRDEIREGKTLRAACDSGWIRARRTILAADFVSFLAAVVLYLISVGGVRGFAFTLGLTTLIDVAVAFLFSRPLVSLFARNSWFAAGSSMTGLAPHRLGVESIPVAGAPRRRTAASAGKES
jgi:preprotein translocase subunit SecD